MCVCVCFDGVSQGSKQYNSSNTTPKLSLYITLEATVRAFSMDVIVRENGCVY